MKKVIRLDSGRYIEINSYENKFSNTRFFILEYVELNTKIFSITLDINSFTSLFTTFYSLEHLDHNTSYQNIINIPITNAINFNTKNSIIILKNANSDYFDLIIEISDIITNAIYARYTIKINTGYIGMIFTVLEKLFFNDETDDVF